MREAKRGEDGIVPLAELDGGGTLGYWIRGHLSDEDFRAALRSYFSHGGRPPRGKPSRDWWRVIPAEGPDGPTSIVRDAEPGSRGAFRVTVLYTEGVSR